MGDVGVKDGFTASRVVGCLWSVREFEEAMGLLCRVDGPGSAVRGPWSVVPGGGRAATGCRGLLNVRSGGEGRGCHELIDVGL